MSKQMLQMFYEMFFNWFFVGVKDGERKEVRVYDSDDWLDMPMSVFQEHVNSEFERLFRKNALGIRGVEELYQEFDKLRTNRQLEHREVPAVFLDELKAAMGTALKGGDWWLAGKQTVVVDCPLSHCPMEKKEDELVDWIFNWAQQAKQSNSAEWEEAVIPSRTVEAVVRAITSCDVCPYAVKEIGSGGCSLDTSYSFGDIAEWDDGEGGRPFLNGLRIHNSELSLFRQSMMDERETIVWEIDQNSEEEFAVVNTPSGFIRMTFDEFVEHWNDLQAGVYNILMGTDEADEVVDGYVDAEVVEDEEVSLEKLQEEEYEEMEEFTYEKQFEF